MLRMNDCQKLRILITSIALWICIACIQTKAQGTFRLTGYVIGDNKIQPYVNVSVKNKNISVTTNFNGKFKIECTLGDTVLIEKKYSRFVIEKYIITDSLPVIVKLINKLELDEKGRPKIYSSAMNSNFMPKVYIVGSLGRNRIWGAGYNLYPRPFFPDNPNIPVLNRISFGVSSYNAHDNFYFFPNMGLNIRNFYKDLFNSNVSFGFMVPSIKLGYWINSKPNPDDGFGYELGLTLFNFSFYNKSPFKNISVDLRYNNFLNKDGALFLSLNFNKNLILNNIPKFINEAIQ
jgi:hypothetical protein